MEQTNHTPVVSVIIATYNRDQFIEEAIKSVLNQTYKNFEVIIVDDGSYDNTKKIIESINDPRIVYFYQSNKGRSNARNKALSLAKGKYITFLDSDDSYLQTKLKIQVDYLNKYPQRYMIYTSAYCINSAGNFINNQYKATASGRIYYDIAFFIPVTITLPTVMVRKEVFDQVGLFDENMYRFEDTDMWRRISKYYEIYALPDFTCKLRTHDDNHLVNQDPKKISSALKYYALKILKEDQDLGVKSLESGLAKLFLHYSSALKTVQKFSETSDELYKIGYMLDPSMNLSKRATSIIYIYKNLYHFIKNKLKNIIS